MTYWILAVWLVSAPTQELPTAQYLMSSYKACISAQWAIQNRSEVRQVLCKEIKL